MNNSLFRYTIESAQKKIEGALKMASLDATHNETIKECAYALDYASAIIDAILSQYESEREEVQANE